MHRCVLLAFLVLGSACAAAGSGSTVCNLPEDGKLQAGSGASTTAQIRLVLLQIRTHAAPLPVERLPTTAPSVQSCISLILTAGRWAWQAGCDSFNQRSLLRGL